MSAPETTPLLHSTMPISLPLTPSALSDTNNNNKHWTKPLILSVSICCLASIQYGFHMSELNAPARYIRLSLGLTQSQLGLITSVFSIGGLLSSTFASYLSTNYGLRVSFIVTSLFYILGSFIESQCHDYNSMLLGRFCSGMGGGLAIVYVPIYMNDISPVALRGILGSMTQISVNFGILLAQCLALKWNDIQQWRKILDIGWIIGVLQLISVAMILVESPKWLIVRNGNSGTSNELNHEAGRAILHRLRGAHVSPMDIKEEINVWEVEKQQHLRLIESQPHLRKLGFWYYLSDETYFNSRTIATFMMLGQQFAGINSVIFYGVDILNKVFPTYAVVANIVISIGNMVITAISSTFMDRLGRRPLLLSSLALMGISLVILSVGILSSNSVLSVVSIFTYVGSFAIGCGPIPFLIVSEVSQIEVKDVAQSWATDCNWVSVFIIGTMFPIMNSLIGGWTYLIFASVCAAFAAFVYFFVPETKGCATYDEVWGVTRNE